MKEKNRSRKQQLKNAKELKARKKALHKDIANFMVDIHLMQIPQPVHALGKFLGTGWKGYHKMKGRNLIQELEREAKSLRSVTTKMFYRTDRSEWTYGQDSEENEALAKDRAKLTERERLTLESDALMNRLIELSFNLDFED
jgi:hypothetical protein